MLILNTLIGWLYLSSLVFVLGVSLSRWTLFAGTGEDDDFPRSFVDATLIRTAIKGGFFLTVAMLMLFFRQLIAFRDPFVPWGEDAWLLLRHTLWGSSWIIALAGCGLAVATLYVKRSAGWGLVTGLLMAVAAFPAFSGHANAVEGISWLSLSADILHVWAAAGWLGSLMFLLVLERSWRRQVSFTKSLLPEVMSNFSKSSMVWVGILIISGVLSSSIHLSTTSDLLTTGYGRVLLLKIVLAVTVMGLGALNWTTLKSGLQHTVSLERLKRVSSKEIWFAQSVLLVTALLIQWAPPGHQTVEHVMNIEMLLIRMIGIGMFFYVTFFVLILLFAIYLLKDGK